MDNESIVYAIFFMYNAICKIIRKYNLRQGIVLWRKKKRILIYIYINLNYSRNRIWTDNSTMNLKIAPYRHNITQLTRQKGIKSLWQSQEQLLSCQGSLIVAIPTVYLAY